MCNHDDDFSDIHIVVITGSSRYLSGKCSLCDEVVYRQLTDEEYQRITQFFDDGVYEEL